jgi:redox-sensitive bicupin YhaK (pirin superfamily)
VDPTSPILSARALGFPWQTPDPFLFCVHHDDHYPAGNEKLGPDASLAGRQLGQDFAGKDGWRMYHGRVVPGFPQHPHRGFETVTIVRSGFIDHSDSLGATARFGQGDVQWLTAGAGIVHCEMFPLLDREGPNPVELFQIWLNLPPEDKLVEPHFSMLWSGDIPRCTFGDEPGRRTEVTVVAGALGEQPAPAPPPHSWAARADSDVIIWCIRMDPGTRWTLPAATGGAKTARTLYFFAGSSLTVAGESADQHAALSLRADADVPLEAGPDRCELLLLQGRPIAKPVVQYGPFVMTSRAEIERAVLDYRRTGFGGWPWPVDDPVHPRDAGRFAKHADGRIEHPSDEANVGPRA